MSSRKGLRPAVFLKNVAIVRNPIARKNIANALIREFLALTHVNVWIAAIKMTLVGRENIKARPKQNRTFHILIVFYKKVCRA